MIKGSVPSDGKKSYNIVGEAKSKKHSSLIKSYVSDGRANTINTLAQ